jgi:hypothetical protein
MKSIQVYEVICEDEIAMRVETAEREEDLIERSAKLNSEKLIKGN